MEKWKSWKNHSKYSFFAILDNSSLWKIGIIPVFTQTVLFQNCFITK